MSQARSESDTNSSQYVDNLFSQAPRRTSNRTSQLYWFAFHGASFKALWSSVDKMQCLSMLSFNLLFDLVFGAREQLRRIQSNFLVFVWLVRTRRRFVKRFFTFNLLLSSSNMPAMTSIATQEYQLITWFQREMFMFMTQSRSSDTRHHNMFAI